MIFVGHNALSFNRIISLPNFGGTFFQTPITCSWNDFFGHFRAQNDHLIIGFLMNTEIFKFQPNLYLWQLIKEGYRQGILADFATRFFKLPSLRPRMDFLDIFSAQNDCPVIGYLSNRVTIRADFAFF